MHFCFIEKNSHLCESQRKSWKKSEIFDSDHTELIFTGDLDGGLSRDSGILLHEWNTLECEGSLTDEPMALTIDVYLGDSGIELFYNDMDTLNDAETGMYFVEHCQHQIWEKTNLVFKYSLMWKLNMF